MLLDGRPDHQDSILVWLRDFFFSKHPSVHPVSYKKYTGVFEPKLKRPERDIDHTASTINEVRVLAAVPPFIFTRSWHGA